MSLAGFLVRPFSRVPLLIIAGQLYGQAGFGRYVFAVGLFEALSAFARLGLRDTLFRFLAEEQDEPAGVLLDALAVAGGLALIVGGGVVLAAPWLGETFGPVDLWRALAELAPLLPIFVVTDLLLAATRAQKTVGYEVVARSLVEPAVLTLTALSLG